MLMMISIIKCVASFSLLLIQLRETRSKCEAVVDDHGTVVGRCGNSGQTSVPQGLGANLQVLDISHNNIIELGTDDLKNYPNLWGLAMVNLTKVSYLPEGFFKYTPLLIMLNISGTNISNFIEVPQTIRFLSFLNYPHHYMNISHLINLEKIRLIHGKLLMLPFIDKSAPMTAINTKFNPLTEANYTQIAPFCQLVMFGLESKELEAVNYTVACCQLRRWAFRHEIPLGYLNQQCSRAIFPTCGDVPFEFSDEAIDLYRDCMRPFRRILFLKILGTIIAVLLILGLIVYLAYRYHKKKKIAKAAASKESESSASIDYEVENEAGQEDSNE